ncbi:MAG: glycosyltransferase, partial [Candidatus Orphnella occulta]|nr:glycosyltransferase [Candidatus Orphnella occulta]
MDKKNLLIITTTFPAGRDDKVSARFVFDLAKSLKSYYNVSVLAPSFPGAEKLENMGGVKVHRFSYFFPASLQRLTTGEGILANMGRNKFLMFQLPFLFFSLFYNLIKIVKKEKIDIINSHWIIPQGLVCALVKKFLRVRHVLTIHSAGIFTLKRQGALGRAIARYIIRRCDLVIPVSCYIKTTLDGMVSEKYNYKIIPMGVDIEFFNRDKPEDILPVLRETGKKLKLLFVGKMIEKKGLKFLLEALSILKQRGRDFKLDVIGGGPLKENIESYVKTLNLSADISFSGWVLNRRLPELYDSCDIAVVPSVFDSKQETEGMPVVILEAMAMGAPVLASDISGIPDIVEHGYNGWLIRPGDSSAIAGQIDEIYDIDITPYRKNAADTALRFSYKETASNYKEAI